MTQNDISLRKTMFLVKIPKACKDVEKWELSFVASKKTKWKNDFGR